MNHETNKTTVIQLRVSPKDKERLKENAAKRGMTLSAYIADCALNYADLQSNISNMSEKITHIENLLQDKEII